MKRELTITYPNGDSNTYYPTHTLVSSQDGLMMSFWWETGEDEVFSLVVNTENVASLEMVTTKDEQPDEVLKLIERAKRGDLDGKQTEG